MKTLNIISVAAITGIAAGAACAEGGAANMIETNGIAFHNNRVVFPTVKVAQDGYLVIHATKDGEIVAPASVAHTAVSKGENKEVAVDMGPDFQKGVRYIAMLHAETNGNDTYDFGEGSTDVDTPVKEGDKVVTAPFDSGDM